LHRGGWTCKPDLFVSETLVAQKDCFCCKKKAGEINGNTEREREVRMGVCGCREKRKGNGVWIITHLCVGRNTKNQKDWSKTKQMIMLDLLSVTDNFNGKRTHMVRSISY